jgi:hypothetical protein
VRIATWPKAERAERKIVRRQHSEGRTSRNIFAGNTARDSTNITEQHVTEWAVMAAEIKQLPDLVRLLKLASNPEEDAGPVMNDDTLVALMAGHTQSRILMQAAMAESHRQYAEAAQAAAQASTITPASATLSLSAAAQLVEDCKPRKRDHFNQAPVL